MKRWMCAFLCGIAALLTAPACRSASVEDVVRSEVFEAIRWEAFWEGAESLGGNYRPGSSIEVRVMRTQDRLYAILGPVHMVLDILTEGPQYRVHTVSIVNPPNTTNAEAAEWFFRLQGQIGAGGCIDTSKQAPNPRAGSTIPMGRPCPAAPSSVLSDNMLPFTLPALTPPDAIQKKTVPPDSGALVAEVRQYIESRRQICGPLKAQIPFYSDTDPRVYVLLSRGGNCPRGVATFSRNRDSRWEFGKFFGDFPQEQLAGVIAKIESNTAITVP